MLVIQEFEVSEVKIIDTSDKGNIIIKIAKSKEVKINL